MEKDNQCISGYAEALFKVAKAENSLDNVEEELSRLKNLLSKSGELKEFIHNARIDTSEKKGALIEVLGKDTTLITLNFLNLIIDQNRQRELPEIIDEYFNLTSSFRNKITAYVISSVPLTEDLIREMEKMLSNLARKDVLIKNEVDESIIGGFIIRIKEKVLDASIQGQFRKLKEKIVQEA